MEDMDLLHDALQVVHFHGPVENSSVLLLCLPCKIALLFRLAAETVIVSFSVYEIQGLL